MFYEVSNILRDRPVILDSSSNLKSMPVKMKFLGLGTAVAPNTVGHMIELVKEASNNIYVRKCAEKIIAGVPPRDELGEIAAVFYFVRDNVRYTKDPRGVEFFYTPVEMLNSIAMAGQAYGDCDDSTNLMASLLRSLGYRTKIRIAGYDGSQLFTHVYLQVGCGGNYDGISGAGERWINLDAIRRNWDLGFEAPGAVRKRDFIID